MSKNSGDCIQEGIVVEPQPNGREADAHRHLSNLLTESTTKVFETMITEDFSFIADESPVDPKEVLAMVGIAGYMSGVLSIECGRNAAIMVAPCQ